MYPDSRGVIMVYLIENLKMKKKKKKRKKL